MNFFTFIFHLFNLRKHLFSRVYIIHHNYCYYHHLSILSHLGFHHSSRSYYFQFHIYTGVYILGIHLWHICEWTSFTCWLCYQTPKRWLKRVHLYTRGYLLVLVWEKPLWAMSSKGVTKRLGTMCLMLNPWAIWITYHLNARMIILKCYVTINNW